MFYWFDYAFFNNILVLLHWVIWLNGSEVYPSVNNLFFIFLNFGRRYLRPRFAIYYCSKYATYKRGLGAAAPHTYKYFFFLHHYCLMCGRRGLGGGSPPFTYCNCFMCATSGDWGAAAPHIYLFFLYHYCLMCGRRGLGGGSPPHIFIFLVSLLFDVW